MSRPVRSRSFRPGWIPTGVALVSVAMLAALGSWQVQRHFWRLDDLAAKNARIDLPPIPLARVREDPEGAAFRRTLVRGAYDAEHSILVVRIPRGIQEGVRILTPLRAAGLPDDRPALLVDRGWAPYGEAQAVLEATPREPVEVTGLFFPLAEPRSAPGTAERIRREWARFAPEREGHVSALQSQLPYRLSPILIQRDARDEANADAYPIGEISRPSSPVDHISYAITWFGLALAAAGTWVGLGLSQGRGAAKRP